SYGGGAYVDENAWLIAEDCTFRNNAALIDQNTGFMGSGGAIATRNARLTVDRSLFERNLAQGFEGGPGGAIDIEGGDAEIDSSEFVENFGGYGGAIAALGCVAVVDCVFNGNQTAYGPSAISLRGGCPVLAPAPESRSSRARTATPLAGGGPQIVGNQF